MLPHLDLDFPGGASGKESAQYCKRRKRHGFIPWVRKMPRRRKWQPTPALFFNICIYFNCLLTWRHRGLVVARRIFYLLQHAGPLVAACRLLVAAHGIKFLGQGSNPGLLNLGHWITREVPRSSILCQGNSTDREAQWAIVHEVAKSRT